MSKDISPKKFVKIMYYMYLAFFSLGLFHIGSFLHDFLTLQPIYFYEVELSGGFELIYLGGLVFLAWLMYHNAMKCKKRLQELRWR